MKRIVCIALGVLLCCVGSAEAEKQQLHNDKDVVSVHTDSHDTRLKAASDGFHITPASTPDHVIGESGPLIMDRQDTKTVQYSNVDAVNRASMRWPCLMYLMLCMDLKGNRGCDVLP